MPPNPRQHDPRILAFADWARSYYSASTLSQYAGMLSKFSADGALTTEEAAVRHVETNYAVSTWGVRISAVRAYFRYLNFVLRAEKDVRRDYGVSLDKFGAYLQTQGLKPSVVYRYVLAVSTMLGLLQGTEGEPVPTPEKVYERMQTGVRSLYRSAWGRYCYWSQAQGHALPPEWLRDGYGFPTPVVVAIRTLTSSPYNWPLEIMCASTYGDLQINEKTQAVTLAHPDLANRTLHWLAPGRSGYEALVTLSEWAQSTVPTRPLIPTTAGGDKPTSQVVVELAIAELGELAVLEQVQVMSRGSLAAARGETRPSPGKEPRAAAPRESTPTDMPKRGVPLVPVVTTEKRAQTREPVREPPKELPPPPKDPPPLPHGFGSQFDQVFPVDRVVLPPPPDQLFKKG